MPPSFNVIGLPDPFGERRIEFSLEQGATIDDALVELVDRAEIPPQNLICAGVVIGDRLIPKAMWSTTRPHAGQEVIIRALPGGDFGSLFVTILGFAAAAFVPGGIGVVSAFGQSFALGTALLKGLVTVGFGLLAQAIAPGPRQQLSSGSGEAATARFSIQGVRNQSRPYGVIPKIFGRVVNYHPDKVAEMTEVGGGEDQFYRALFVVGHGPLKISNLKIGEKPIESFGAVQWQIDQGLGASTLSLYPRQVREEALAVRLLKDDGYTEQVTPPDTDEIRLDVLFPGGLLRTEANGKKQRLEVEFQVQVKPLVGGTWVNAPLNQTWGTVLLGGGRFKCVGRSKSAVRRAVGFARPNGQYKVRMRRLTDDDQSIDPDGELTVTTEEAVWSAIHSYDNRPPVAKDGLAMIAVRFKATDQLNGVISNLSCDVEAMLPTSSNGVDWTVATTRNPAFAMIEVLTNEETTAAGDTNARPVPLSRLNLTELLAWAEECDTQGYTFDGVINFRSSVWQMVQDIASTGRASPNIIDGQYSVVEDKPRTVVRQHFTSRNLRNVEVTRVFADLPHAIKVRFPDVAALHQTVERSVYADGYNATNATKFEVIDLPYTTSADQAWKFGRWAWAATRLRPELMAAETDIEHIAVTRGDLVHIAVDVIKVGLGQCLVTSTTLNGSNEITAIGLEMPMPMVDDVAYAFRLRKAVNGETKSVVYAVDTVAGESASLTLTTPIPDDQVQPERGDLIMFGEAGLESREWLVRSIEPRADFSARLTFVPHSPAIYDADKGVVPAWDPGITQVPDIDRGTPPLPVVLSVDSDEDALQISNNGSLSSHIVLGVDLNTGPRSVEPDFVKVRWREVDSGDPFTLEPYLPIQTTAITLGPVEDGLTYEIELQNVTNTGLASELVRVVETVIGQSTPPPDVPELFRAGPRMVWPYPTPPLDFAGFEARANAGINDNWEQGASMHPGVAFITVAEISLLNRSGTETVMIKAVDRAGNVSVNAAVAVLNLGDPDVNNVVLTQSEDPSFNGRITGGTVNASVLEADIDTAAPVWSTDSALYWSGNDAALFWSGATTYQALEYVATYTPLTSHTGATVTLNVASEGQRMIDYRKVNDPAVWSTDGALYWSGNDAAMFWSGDPATPWQPFPGLVGPLEANEKAHEFRVSLDPGNTRGRITTFDVVIDVVDVVEEFLDFAIGDSGTQLTLTQPFNVVDYVAVLAVQDDGNGARQCLLRDGNKDISTGLFMDCYDDSLTTQVAGTVDLRVKGH